MNEGSVMQGGQRGCDLRHDVSEPHHPSLWDCADERLRGLASYEILDQEWRAGASIAIEVVRAHQAGNIEPPKQRKFRCQLRRIERARTPDLGHQRALGRLAIAHA